MDGNSSRSSVQSDQVKEEEFLREMKILLEQTVPEKAAVRIRQQSLAGFKSHRANAARAEYDRFSFRPARPRPQLYFHRVHEQQFIQQMMLRAVAIQEESQIRNLERRQRQASERIQLDS